MRTFIIVQSSTRRTDDAFHDRGERGIHMVYRFLAKVLSE